MAIYTTNNKIWKLDNKWINNPSVSPLDEVTIGTQTWKSKNLAIDDGGEGIEIRNIGIVNGVDLGTQYFYTWDAAVRVANSIPGWHLPTKDEWITLALYVGGEQIGTGNNYRIAGDKLKSTNGWNLGNDGTDDYGFTVLPVGYINSQNEVYVGKGSLSILWTSDTSLVPSTGTAAYYCYFNGTDTITINIFNKTDGLSVRLIKDS